MTDAELNRKIWAALDMPVKLPYLGRVADYPVPDYANDLNASMAAIREHPGWRVALNEWYATICDRHDNCLGENTEGQDDAHRLARALLEALGGEMTDAELNRKIAEKRGCEWELMGDGAVVCICEDGEHTVNGSHNYANSIDASMAAIRKRWPDAWIGLGDDNCRIWDEWGSFFTYYSTPSATLLGLLGESEKGPGDAHRLARALLEALTEVGK